MHHARFTALLVATLLGCGRELSLPAAPTRAPPALTAFEPEAAFAGEVLVLSGARLNAGTEVKVRFTGGREAVPRRRAEDGSSLEVEVPDDAQSGPLTVVTADGAATSERPFEYRGLGRLRRVAVRATADLRPVPLAVFPVGGAGDVGVYVPAYNRFGISDGISDPQFIELGYIQDVVPVPLRKGAAVLSAAFPEDCRPSQGCVAELELRVMSASELYAAVEPETPPPPVVSWRIDREPEGEFVLAMSDDGQEAFVADEIGGWVLDLATQPPKMSDVAAPGGARWNEATWFGGKSFVVCEDAGVRLVDPAAPGGLGEKFEPFGADGDLVHAVAFDGVDTLAIVAADRIGVMRAATWPPSSVQTIVLRGTDRLAGSLALASDPRRLFVGLGAQVLTYDLTGEKPRPMTSTPNERDTQRLYLAEGSVWAARRGGAGVIAATTGLPFGSVSVRSHPRTPQLRTSFCGPEGEKRRVLEVPLGGLFDVGHLDPDTLKPLDCDRVDLGPVRGSAIRALAGREDSGHLYAMLTDRVLHFAPGRVTPDPSFALSFEGNGVPVERITPERMHVNTRGDWLLARVKVAVNPVVSHLYLVPLTPLAAPGGPASPALVFPNYVIEADIEEDALVVVTADGVRRYDVHEAAAGKLVALEPAHETSDPVIASTIRGGAAYVVTGTLQNRALRRLDLARPSRIDDSPLLLAGYFEVIDGFLSSPSARQLSWTEKVGTGRSLMVLPLTPGSLAAEAPIPLTLPQPWRTYTYPDGEQMIVTDRDSDDLVMID